ncbi:hypothetical protein N7535_006562 [Penicillium sp. DV-2018c]|nr:hypothetical protein N7461_007354 [Penicillium sp. DV-2018c]KAJ5567256.1 hypothetical protein N7535_006562 [Penicillium sp. DV-2018c]
MDPITNPDDSPFRNLDLWCDWNGDVTDPVSIKVSLEVSGRPNLNLPILNVQSPNVVKGPARIIRLKPDCDRCEAHPSPLEVNDAPSGFDDDATEIYTATNRVASDSRSVHFQGKSSGEDAPLVSEEDGPTHQTGVYATTQNGVPDSSQCASYTTASIFQSSNSESQDSPNPRKRSAETASLPDSISADDECDGTRPNPSKSNTKSSKPSSKIARSHSKKGSFIPVSIQRASSRAGSSATSERVEFVRSLTPSPEAAPTGSESKSLPAVLRSTVVENVPDEGTPPWHSPETPPNKIDLGVNEPSNKASLHQWSCDRMSTRACQGSFSSTEESDDETDDPLLSDCTGTSSQLVHQICPHRPPTQPSINDIAERDVPTLVMDNRILYLQTSPTVYPEVYEIGLWLKVRLQKGKSNDWWELIINGLPRLAQFESGYFYIRTPPGQGMEFVTSPFKRHTLVESCLMSQFESGKSLVVPLRRCSAEDFGYLKDYKVNAVIKSEIEETRDPSSWLVKYNAVCSIDLINRSFWAKQCKFYLYVHGGPEGEFDAVLDAERPLIKDIRLEQAPGGRIGVSKIHVTSIPGALNMFKVCWEITLPREDAFTWLPWIKSTHRNLDAEDSLRREYESLDPMNHYDDVLDSPRVISSCKDFCSRHDVPCSCEHRDKKVTFAEAEDLDFSPCADLPDYEEVQSGDITPNLLRPLATEPQDPIPPFPADESPGLFDPIATDSQEPILSARAHGKRGMITENLPSVYPHINTVFASPAVCRDNPYSAYQFLEMPRFPNSYAPERYPSDVLSRLARNQVPETRVRELEAQETEAPETQRNQLPELQLPEPYVPASTAPEMSITKPKLRYVGSVLSSLVYLIKNFLKFIILAASIHYWSVHIRPDSVTFHSPGPYNHAAAFHPMRHERDPHYTEPVKGTESDLPELLFQPTPLPSESESSELKQSADDVFVNSTPILLRDRLDYFLGWRGPIARE